jgi:hypothetical protein
MGTSRCFSLLSGVTLLGDTLKVAVRASRRAVQTERT